MARVVGIDLGTTNSLVAFMDGDRPRIVPNAAGARMTPSVVGLDAGGRLHVGAAAKSQLTVAPERTVAEVKRRMGTAERVRLGERTYTPTEISALILRALKDDAERFFGEPVDEAVVTVPAYFTDAQRQATKDAGDLAGLRVDRILNEPTAAALAYGLDHLDKEQTVVVYDLGGGTFDVSVLEMYEGVLDVKASAGNNRLGGGDFDRALAAWIAAEIERSHGLDLRSDARATARVLAAAEEAKRQLSAADTALITLPGIGVRGGAAVTFETEISRRTLEDLIGPLVRSTLDSVRAALLDAKVDARSVADVVLVGGSSRLPLVRALVAELFGKEPRRGVDPDEAIALGAAVQAGLKTGAISAQTGIMITDVCPFTLGIDVATHAGSQVVGGLFSPIIPRNSTVPVSRTEIYATASDQQRAVDVQVYQGDARMVRHNVFLGHYTVEGIPPGPKGSQKIAITFSYDINGILQVTTKVLATGKEASIRIDKSPERMSIDERATAAARLDREWSTPARSSATASSPADGANRPGERGATVTSAPPGLVTSTAPSDHHASAAALASQANALRGGSPSGDAHPATVAAQVDALHVGGPAGGIHAAALASPVDALLLAARRKLAALPDGQAHELAAVITALEQAAAARDAAAIARLEARLTDVLFDLD